MKKGIVIACVLLLIAYALWRQLSVEKPSVETRIGGRIFGSTYSIVINGLSKISRSEIMARVEKRLSEIDATFSGWRDDSELARINRAEAGTPISISKDFARVLKEALHLAEMTDGAYDITVGPLVRLWGFGPNGARPKPTAQEILEAEDKVGFRNLKFKGTSLTKLKDGMVIDLSSKVPGYAADQIGALLEDIGVSDYIVEVGGEITLRGRSPKGELWTVGIETPKDNEMINSDLFGAMRISNGAVSTSGTYHQFRKSEAGKAHHIIDPGTGAPVNSNLVSVTVTAPTCTEADGLGTALLVMGVDKGLAWIARHPRFDALFLTKTDNGFAQRMSAGFSKYLIAEKP
jgi:thiamine biosynthesis lipoprotein